MLNKSRLTEAKLDWYLQRRKNDSVHRRDSSGFLVDAINAFVFFVSVACIFFVSVNEGALSIIWFYCVLFLLGLTISAWIHGDSRSLRLFLVSFSFNTIVVVLLYYYYVFLYGAPYYLGGSDDFWYEQIAKSVAENLSLFDYASMRDIVYSNYYGYFYILAVIYRLGEILGGANTVNPRLVNSFIIGLTSVLIFNLGKRSKWSTGASIRAGYATAFFPLISFWGALIIRDVFIAFLLVLCAYVYSIVVDSRAAFVSKIFGASLLAIFLRILWEFRSYNVILFLFVAFVAFGWDLWNRSKLSYKLIGFGFTVLSFVLLWQLYSSELLRLYDRLHIYQAAQLERATPDGFSRFVFNSPVPLTYFLRIGYALVSPLPVPSPNLAQTFVNFGTFIWFFGLPFLFLSIRQAVKMPQQRMILLLFGALFLSIALTDFIDRHRLPSYPFAFLLIFGAWERHRSKVPIFLFTGTIIGFIGVIYFLLKFR